MVRRKMLILALGLSAVSLFGLGCKTSATEQVANSNMVYLTGEFPSADEFTDEEDAAMSILLNDKVDVDLDELYETTESENIKQAIDYARGKEKETMFLRLLLEDGEIDENDLANLMNPDVVEFATTVKEECFTYNLGLMVSMQRTRIGLSNMENDDTLSEQARKIIESGRYNESDNIYVLKDKSFPITTIYDIDTMIASDEGAGNFLFTDKYNKIGCCSYTKKMGNEVVEQYVVIVLGNGDIATFEEYEFTEDMLGGVVDMPIVEPEGKGDDKSVIINGELMTTEEAGIVDYEIEKKSNSISEGAGVESEISVETVIEEEKTTDKKDATVEEEKPVVSEEKTSEETKEEKVSTEESEGGEEVTSEEE